MVVVVTGVGLCTSLGPDVLTSWDKLVHPSPLIPLPSERGEGSHFGFTRAQEMAESATLEALGQADLWDGSLLQGIDPERIGCTVSASKPLATSFPAGDDVWWTPPDAV